MTLRDAAEKASSALAAAFFLLVLFSLAQVASVPRAIVAFLIGFLILAVFRPTTAMLVLVAVLPVAMFLGRRWDGSIAWPEALVAAYSAGYFLRSSTKPLER